METFTTFDERLTGMLSTSFYSYLLHNNSKKNYIENPCFTQDLVDQALREIRRRRSTALEIDDPSDSAILEKAQERALRLWKDEYKCASTDEEHSGSSQNSPKPTSISLFLNQFHSGCLTRIITWDKIQEQATSPQEKLTLLKKIEYIDDILQDWEEVLPFLQASLADREATILVDDVVHLHRMWFNLTRGSSVNQEYQSVQINLMQNLVTAVDSWATKMDGDGKPSPSIELCARTSLDMFGDWINRIGASGQRDDSLQKIVTSFWGWIGHQRMQHIMHRHCPYAKWLAKWIAYLTPEESIALVSDASPFSHESNTLSCLFIDASTNLHAVSQLSVVERDVRYSTAVFNLAVLRSVLVSTRVSHFPWHLLQPAEDQLAFQAVTTRNSQFQLLNLYIQLIQMAQVPTERGVASREVNDYHLLLLCVDAIETLLCGSYYYGSTESRMTNTGYNDMEVEVSGLLSRVASTGVSHRVLRSMLDRVQRCCSVPSPSLLSQIK